MWGWLLFGVRNIFGNIGSVVGIFLVGGMVLAVWRILWALGFGFLAFTATHFGVQFFLDFITTQLGNWTSLTGNVRSVVSSAIIFVRESGLPTYMTIVATAYAVVATLNWLPRLGVLRKGYGIY